MAISSIDNLIFSFVTSFAITYLAVPSIILVAREKNLFDEPDDRTSHFFKKPTLGGLAIFAGIIFSITFWTDFAQCWRLQYLLAATTVISFIGLKDDIIGLPPFKKAIGQLVAASILVVWGEIRITSFFGIFGIYDLPDIISILFTVFTIFIIINSINLIDGIDGLASTLGIIYSLTLGVYFFMLKEFNQEAIVAFSLVGALLAFLRYNSSPAKIFMGDTGSLMIGLIIAVLIIEFIEVNKYPVYMYHINSAPIVAVGILIVPLFDLLRVFTIRIFQKKSPFVPDRNHVHHLLLNIGFTHNFATFIIATFTLFMIFLVFLFRNIGIYYLALMIIILKIIFIYYIIYLSKKKEKPMNG
jgi:UDP-GlcNAc:undecaprenyl-phosphate/decaprenyl-phosphate GlcNAc-1-phosphate transferase